MEAHWIWWLAAVVLVIAEMASGTFYLVAVAFGLAVAGLVAYSGMAWGGQAAVAALLCSASVVWIYRWRKRHVRKNEHPNLANDIGQTVRVVQWSDERHARVSYRGAEWDAELSGKAQADTGRQTWQIRDITGTRLIIE